MRELKMINFELNQYFVLHKTSTAPVRADNCRCE